MKPINSAVAVLAGVLAAGTAEAHIEVSSGPAAANKSQEVTFTVGHGCNDLDTYRLRIEIPDGVTSVRALSSDFGKPAVEKDDTGAVVAVTWQKPLEDLQESDVNLYKLGLRLKTPDAPFSHIFFPVYQTCRDSEGNEVQVDWVALPGQTGEPAAVLTIVPARQPGWNRYTLGGDTHIADLSVYFADAVIVWKGNAAWSPNEEILAQIGETSGIVVLSGGAHPDDELWVKY